MVPALGGQERGLDEPRQAQAQQDVERVGPYRIADAHRAVAWKRAEETRFWNGWLHPSLPAHRIVAWLRGNSLTLLGNDDAGHGLGHTGSRSQERYSHHGVGDLESVTWKGGVETSSSCVQWCPGRTPRRPRAARPELTDDGDEPGHDVGQAADPDDAHEESEREQLFEPWFLAVRNGEEEHEVDGPRDDADHAAPPAALWAGEELHALCGGGRGRQRSAIKGQQGVT